MGNVLSDQNWFHIKRKLCVYVTSHLVSSYTNYFLFCVVFSFSFVTWVKSSYQPSYATALQVRLDVIR